MVKYKKIIIQVGLLAFFLFAFILGYALAMFKQSMLAKRATPAPAPLACDCDTKPNLSFKEILSQNKPRPIQRSAPPNKNAKAATKKTVKAIPVESADGSIRSLAGLKQFLNNLTVDNFDLALIRDYVDSSSEAFQYIISEFNSIKDPQKRGLLLDVISETDNPEKITFAQELISSSATADRKRAYSWLADSEQNGAAQNALINASYYEESPEALTDIVSALSVVDLESDIHSTAVGRLSELSFHENTDVAAHAIGVVSGISQDESTLTMLNSHVNGTDEKLKIAALNGLYYFEGGNKEAYDSVARIFNDPSASRDTKDIAGELLSVWDQNRSVEEGNFAEAEGAYYDHED